MPEEILLAYCQHLISNSLDLELMPFVVQLVDIGFELGVHSVSDVVDESTIIS